MGYELKDCMDDTDRLNEVDKMISEDILDNLRRSIREREKATVGFSVQMEVKGHFLELTGIPDERMIPTRLQKAIAEVNNYNSRSFWGELVVIEEACRIVFKVQHVLNETEDAAGEALTDYIFRQMEEITQWIGELNADEDSVNKPCQSESNWRTVFDIREKLFKSCEVYDRVKEALEGYHVRYKAVPNCMEVCCEWSGQEKPEDREIERGRQTYQISVNPRRGMLQFLAELSVHVSEAETEKYLKYCMRLNRDIWGQFYVNTATDSVYYYLTTPYPNGPVTQDWIARQIAAAEHAIGVWQQREMGEDESCMSIRCV